MGRFTANFLFWSCRHRLLSTASVLALSLWCGTQEAAAVCPVGPVTSGTFNTTPGDTCPDGLAASGTGIINAPSVTVPIANPALSGALATAGGTINFSGGSVITTVGGGAAAIGTGSFIDARNGTQISVTAGNGSVVFMQNGGLVAIDASTGISTTGSGIFIDNTAVPLATLGSGIVVDVTGAVAGRTGVTVQNNSTATFDSLTVTGNGVFGLIAANNSTVTLTGTTAISTSEPQGQALRANPGSLITGTSRPTLTSTNGTTNASAVNATGGGRIELANGFVATATGTNSSAVSAVGAGSFIDATHNSLITANASGPFTQGILMFNGGLVEVDSTTGIFVNGPGAGIKVDGTIVDGTTINPGTTINLMTALPSNVSIGLWSTRENGAFASVVTADNLTVTGPGTRQLGLFAQAGGTINLSNSSITINGDGNSGAAVAMESAAAVPGFDAGGIVNLTNTTLLANGAATAAVRARTGTAAAPNTFTASGGTITSAASPAFAAQGAFLNATLSNGVVVTGGNGRLIDATVRIGAPALVNLAATTGAILKGDAFADADSTLNLSLASSALWTGAALNVTNVNVLAGGQWDMTADSTVSQQVTNAGFINYLPGGPFKTLTTANYLGLGGTLGINTFLGDDSSPSDLLVIDGGTATGRSLLRVTNTTGPGALTVANGILVVDAINGGTTQPGLFTLSGPVFAGPYDYSLFRGGPVAGFEDDWFLRSVLDCDRDPTNPACPDPDPDPDPDPPVPDFRPETSLYAAIPSLALTYGRALLDTLHERVGEEEDQRGEPMDNRLGWGRIIGMHGDHEGDRLGIFGDGPEYDYDIFALQAGADLWRREGQDGGRDQAGGYFAIGETRGDVTHIDGTEGDTDFDAVSLGGYWTHFGPEGWYVDAVLQGTFYDIESTANRGIPALETEGLGFGASAEAGYPIRFDKGYFFEPQAQAIFQTIDIDDASDPGAEIRFDDADSVTARIGARFGRSFVLDELENRTLTVWLRPNLWNEFLGNPTTSFSSATGFIPFKSQIDGLTGEINAGISGEIGDTITLYANASYFSSFDGDDTAFDGKVGLRVVW